VVKRILQTEFRQLVFVIRAWGAGGPSLVFEKVAARFEKQAAAQEALPFFSL
jgi:accessory colonization factor AcfC